MYGALLEREGLFRRAAEALRSALACLDPERDVELCNKVYIAISIQLPKGVVQKKYLHV